MESTRDWLDDLKFACRFMDRQETLRFLVVTNYAMETCNLPETFLTTFERTE